MSEKPLFDPATEKVVSLAEETKFSPNGIVSRTLLRTDTTRVVLFGFGEGQELPSGLCSASRESRMRRWRSSGTRREIHQ